ncbi:MAG: RNA methyltransferase [Terracidiphilus sp.]|nr:RNA methyltransferase [Terracidiphilus sp.]
MLNEDQRERLDVVLVSPRNPLNIGAVARAMANFGLDRLTVVAPYAPLWREARSAVGAPELLANARETPTVGEAIAACTLVIGTGTLTYRKPEQIVVPLPELAPHVAVELARGGRVAVIFGPENHGLTREDLSYCHVMVEIPTDPRQPSMNLGQAVAVCLYELSARVNLVQPLAENRGSTAPSATLNRLGTLIEETMAAAGYSPATMQEANRHDLRLLLRRLRFDPLDTRRALGFFRRVLHRLQARGK